MKKDLVAVIVDICGDALVSNVPRAQVAKVVTKWVGIAVKGNEPIMIALDPNCVCLGPVNL